MNGGWRRRIFGGKLGLCLVSLGLFLGALLEVLTWYDETRRPSHASLVPVEQAAVVAPDASKASRTEHPRAADEARAER